MSDRRTYLGARLSSGDSAAWELLLATVTASAGNLAEVARRLETPLRTAQSWLQRYPRLRQAVRAARSPAGRRKARKVASSRAANTTQQLQSCRKVA